MHYRVLLASALRNPKAAGALRAHCSPASSAGAAAPGLSSRTNAFRALSGCIDSVESLGSMAGWDGRSSCGRVARMTSGASIAAAALEVTPQKQRRAAPPATPATEEAPAAIAAARFLAHDPSPLKSMRVGATILSELEAAQ
jgi:hypothetical protein